MWQPFGGTLFLELEALGIHVRLAHPQRPTIFAHRDPRLDRKIAQPNVRTTVPVAPEVRRPFNVCIA